MSAVTKFVVGAVHKVCYQSFFCNDFLHPQDVSPQVDRLLITDILLTASFNILWLIYIHRQLHQILRHYLHQLLHEHYQLNPMHKDKVHLDIMSTPT